LTVLLQQNVAEAKWRRAEITVRQFYIAANRGPDEPDQIFFRSAMALM